jgi:hypothetical protein
MPTATRSSRSPSRLRGTEELTWTVAIIGRSHPFGRHGDRSRSRWAPTPQARAAGCRHRLGRRRRRVWRELGRGADPLTGLLGLTGIPFINVFNACATGNHHATGGQRHRGQRRDIVGRRHGQAPSRRVQVDPTLTNVPAWYGDNSQFTTTKFFGMKIRYMHDHGISHETLARVAAELPPGSQPERLPKVGHQRGRDPRIADAQLP